jgi:dihydroorotate dehydrogenase
VNRARQWLCTCRNFFASSSEDGKVPVYIYQTQHLSSEIGNSHRDALQQTAEEISTMVHLASIVFVNVSSFNISQHLFQLGTVTVKRLKITQI